MLRPALSPERAFAGRYPGRVREVRVIRVEDGDDAREIARAAGARYVVSVSEIEQFLGCPRQWAYMRIGGVPKGPPNQWLTAGIELHEILADYFRLGSLEWGRKYKPETDPRAKTARAMLDVALELGFGEYVVEPTYMLLLEDGPAAGTAVYIKPDLTLDREWLVDWKSTGTDFRQTEKTLQETGWWLGGLPEGFKSLENNPQARIYSFGLMTLWHTRRANAMWVYGNRNVKAGKPAKAWPVCAAFGLEETGEWLESYIWPVVGVMNRLRDAAGVPGPSDARMTFAGNVPMNPLAKCNWCDAMVNCLQMADRTISYDDLKTHLPVKPD